MTGNNKVFSRKRRPGKRDYYVCVTLDISASTSYGSRADLIREMGMALGELLHRAGSGVKFSMYAHTGVFDYDDDYVDGGYKLDMYVIKDRIEPWSEMCRTRIEKIGPFSANIDGHTLEFVRKRCDESDATDKLILYVTDGDMPAENFHEELRVLERELKTCEKKGYHILGVGIQNDEPTKYGLDTVRLDRTSDLPKLITEMRTRLAMGVES